RDAVRGAVDRDRARAQERLSRRVLVLLDRRRRAAVRLCAREEGPGVHHRPGVRALRLSAQPVFRLSRAPCRRFDGGMKQVPDGLSATIRAKVIASTGPTGEPAVNVKKLLTRLVQVALILAPLCYFFPKLMLFYFACGLYDVSRNRRWDLALVDRYFFGNGVTTWLLSPFNVLMDILALPYINKGVYKLEDLPKDYQ